MEQERASRAISLDNSSVLNICLLARFWNCQYHVLKCYESDLKRKNKRSFYMPPYTLILKNSQFVFNLEKF